MKGIILWYNANRKTIWKIVGVVVVAILGLQLIQYVWKQRQQNENGYTENTNEVTVIGSRLNTITIQESESVVTGDKITQAQESQLTILDNFVNYCNENKINEAYALLSDDCKSEMYPKVENFKQSYYNAIFAGGKRNVSVENWFGNVYKVKFINDALSTGVYDKQNIIQDYITLVNEDQGNVKLNINNYIGKQDINKENESYNIKTKVIEKHTYMDYETYTFEVTNNSNTTILLNNNNNMDTMYLEDTRSHKYNAYVQEIPQVNLQIGIKETKRFTIKYYNQYSSSKTINKIVFGKVLLDYNAYKNYSNPGFYSNYGMIEIDL